MIDLSSARFAFLDLETTGLSPWFGDRICEVGIVISEGKRIRKQYRQLVNPERPLSPGAASTNGLSDGDLRVAPLFAQVADEVAQWLKGAVVVCHGAANGAELASGIALAATLVRTDMVARLQASLRGHALVEVTG